MVPAPGESTRFVSLDPSCRIATNPSTNNPTTTPTAKRTPTFQPLRLILTGGIDGCTEANCGGAGGTIGVGGGNGPGWIGTDPVVRLPQWIQNLDSGANVAPHPGQVVFTGQSP